jgi:RimJ/RimL family protein N-acetyltransferase
MRAQPVSFPRQFRRIDVPCAVRFGPHLTFLRPLQPDDVDRLLAFFATHTQDTIRSRYGYVFAQMTRSRAAELVGVDQNRDVALGVFEAGEPDKPLIAIGRYCLDDTGHAAEVAFVVREDRRSLGIATTLLRALESVAHDRGLRRLTAQVQYDNPAMLAVFRRAGATLSDIPGTGSLAVEIRLPATPCRSVREH